MYSSSGAKARLDNRNAIAKQHDMTTVNRCSFCHCLVESCDIAHSSRDVLCAGASQRYTNGLEKQNQAALFLTQLVLREGDADPPVSFYGEALDILSCILQGKKWQAPDPEDPHPSQIVDLLIDKEIPSDHVVWDFIKGDE